MIDPDLIPRRAREVHEQPLEDELLLFTDELPHGIVLNLSAWAIWDLCDGRRSLQAISKDLANSLGCSAAEILPQVHQAVVNLAASELLLLSPPRSLTR